MLARTILRDLRAIDPMRVLVTRPLPDAETTATDLRRRGHEAVTAPMLETQFIDWVAEGPKPSGDAFRQHSAIVATSLNGIRALARHPEIDSLKLRPLYVVGDASKRHAEALGFGDIRPAHGDASDVAALMIETVIPGSDVLYAAGHDRIGDLEGTLTQAGIHVELVEVYRALPATGLPENALSALQANEIDCILIFSARTGETLVNVLAATGLLPNCRNIPIHAISSQAAEPLRAAGFGRIIVAGRPDAAELLDTMSRKL
jgi:uroporphyrinogen-III synthase